jgi:Holliday junction resolvasome RuvABC DNA-binding subunit
MKEEQKKVMQTVVNALIEQFDYFEEITGVDYKHAKRIILSLAKKHKIFE